MNADAGTRSCDRARGRSASGSMGEGEHGRKTDAGMGRYGDAVKGIRLLLSFRKSADGAGLSGIQYLRSWTPVRARSDKHIVIPEINAGGGIIRNPGKLTDVQTGLRIFVRSDVHFVIPDATKS